MMTDVLMKLRQLRQQANWTHEQLRAYQVETLHDLRKYAYAHSPFYQEFHKGLYDAPLQELPVLTKAVMMEHFDEVVTDRAIHLKDVQEHIATLQEDERYLGHYWVNATSGSTGRPGAFVNSSSEWATILASFGRAREWAGLKVSPFHRVKTAIIASTVPWHLSVRASTSVRSWMVPELRLAVSEPVDSMVRQLNDWQPHMLVAYTSVAGMLAEEQLAGRLHISPSLVYTSAEMLTAETRERIEQAWGKVLYNEYAATETGCLAAECEHHQGLHLFEDLVIVELVDQENRPVPPGTYGDKLLITVLFRRTQPLIRYELSDSLQLTAAACASGRPFAIVNDIQGRVEDVLSLPSIVGGILTVRPLVFNRIMDTIPVSGWQIVQEADSLHVLLSGVRDGFTDEVLIDRLQQALTAQGVVVPPINVQRVAAIPRGATGKAPLIKSNLPRKS
jgi:putative adenylate-forming enzyme